MEFIDVFFIHFSTYYACLISPGSAKADDA